MANIRLLPAYHIVVVAAPIFYFADLKQAMVHLYENLFSFQGEHMLLSIVLSMIIYCV